MHSPKYIVDTNVILARVKHREYDETVFPIHWKNFDKLVDEGIIISITTVEKEIEDLVEKNKYNEEILTWVKNHSQMFKLPKDNKYMEETKNIKNELPGYFEYYDKKSFADAYLVVYAKAYNLILVTQELPNKKEPKANKFKNLKIPTACKKLGGYYRCGLAEVTSNIDPNQTSFQCINFVELARREKLNKIEFDL